MTTHERLVEGLNCFDARGWWQHGRCESVNGVCPVLAILDEDARQVYAETVGLTHQTEIPTWNDDPARTKGEVRQGFVDAIAATAPLPEDLDLTLPAHLDASPEAVSFP